MHELVYIDVRHGGGTGHPVSYVQTDLNIVSVDIAHHCLINQNIVSEIVNAHQQIWCRIRETQCLPQASICD